MHFLVFTGTMTKDVDQLTAFNPDFCPRVQKNAWVHRLKELMRVDNGTSLGIIPVIKEEVCEKKKNISYN